MRKEKGKKKMAEYGMDRYESDRRESNSEKSDDGSSRVKFDQKGLNIGQ